MRCQDICNPLESLKFEAQPKPTATWFIKGDKEILISVGPEERRMENYVVYPLEKVSFGSSDRWKEKVYVANGLISPEMHF